MVCELLDDVAEQLIALMGELSNEKDSFEELGIGYEEKAFFDVLVSVEEKYGFEFPKEKNIALAKKIYKLVSDKAKYADWANRADIKAELQADIIIALAEEGFPPIPGANNPEDYQSVYTSVIEQAEIFRKYYR